MATKLAHPSDHDTDLINRAAAGDGRAVREIIQSNNQRLYRLVRSVLRDDTEAEDVLQEAYISAFRNLGGFKGEAALSTWLSRIALNAAFVRLRSHKRLKRAEPTREQLTAEIIPFPLTSTHDDPERVMAQRQLLRLVEEAADTLPEEFRVVFVARVIEGLSVEETSELLDVPSATVKTRLHRARKLVRQKMEASIGPILTDAFPFAGKRCARLTELVMARLELKS